MPRERQRIVFSAQGQSDGLRWVLNGRDLGLARGPTHWAPASGRYLLSLSDAGGATIDSVRFQVRGHADLLD
jgi:penicillin-binding protein 1C